LRLRLQMLQQIVQARFAMTKVKYLALAELQLHVQVESTQLHAS
jgi:hypothetical protein